MICRLCGKEIPVNSVHQDGLHMSCAKTDIDVFFVACLDAPKHGFYERDIKSVAESLSAADYGDSYLVRKEEMVAEKYFSLPDFQGF